MQLNHQDLLKVKPLLTQVSRILNDTFRISGGKTPLLQIYGSYSNTAWTLQGKSLCSGLSPCNFQNVWYKFPLTPDGLISVTSDFQF